MGDPETKYLNRKRIRHWMVDADCTQKQLAVKSGIQESHLSMLLSGSRHATWGTIARLSRATGIPMDDIFMVPKKKRKKSGGKKC